MSDDLRVPVKAAEPECTCNFCVTGERDGYGHDDGPRVWAAGEALASAAREILRSRAYSDGDSPFLVAARIDLRSALADWDHANKEKE